MKYRKLKDGVANFKTHAPNIYMPTIHAHVKGVICPVDMAFIAGIHYDEEGNIIKYEVDERLSTEYLDPEKDYDIYADEDDLLYVKNDDEYIPTIISVKDLSKFNSFTPEFE